MKLRYEIEEGTNAVKLFADDSDIPCLYQPVYPDGTVWLDAAEAEEWAQLHIASMEDESAPFAPISRGVPGRAKPTPEELAEMNAMFEQQRAAMMANLPPQPE